MSILFISELELDAHLLPVAAELGRRGHDVAVFNPGDFPSKATITVSGSAGGQRALLSNSLQTIDLNDVQSVWYRRPGTFTFAPELEQAERAWLRDEATDLVGAIWANSRALWVSEPRAIRFADLKLVQLAAAAELGFATPNYLVTNDPTAAHGFIDAQPDGAIVKALNYPTIERDGAAGMIYTHRLTAADLAELDAVRYGPAFFQQYIPKRYDLRVTVIGDRLFAVRIDPRGHGDAEVDFRRAEIFDLPHTPVELPRKLHDACLALTAALGLQFGAIDLVQTADGEYFFLEINPNGQWYWIEMMTELPMARAMADLLERAGGAAVLPTKAPNTSLASSARTLAIGAQTLPLPQVLAEPAAQESSQPALSATGVWFARRAGRYQFRLGDIERDRP